MIAKFLFGVNCMGCLWRVLKALIIAFLVAIVAGYCIYNTDWFQKKYMYPLPYKDQVWAAAQEYQVDPYLIYAVMRTESRYVVAATSPKGARGLMQIMPETGAWIAESIKMNDFHSAMLYEPSVNIRLATWYIASLRDEFDGNVILTLAAYNGGRGNVKQWKQQYGWPPNFNNTERIPYKETREYVLKVMDAYGNYIRLYGPKG